ncbi:MAG: hypothetical protein HQL66_08980 [Magnetococcales bacterium]|nr:hypothetical protein [Magnetococcales bacterium]
MAEQHNVVTILGNRGSGKTTLLRQIATKLKEGLPRYGCSLDLVIGPITPLHFRETRSLFSHVLATVQREVFGEEAASDHSICPPWSAQARQDQEAACGPTPPPRQRHPDLERCWEDLRRFVARTVPISLETLIKSGKSGEDFAYHFSSVQDSMLRARENYPYLVNNLLKFRLEKLEDSSRQHRHGDLATPYTPMLVIILDDCDLFPELIRLVLDDIQRLCESPHVIVLFASNEEALYRSVGESMLNEKKDILKPLSTLGLAYPEGLRAEVALYIGKVCPLAQRLRLMPEIYSLATRLNFVPLGGTPSATSGSTGFHKASIGALLRQLELPTGHFLAPNLLALFNPAEVFPDAESFLRGLPPPFSPLCELLPNTPRGLVNLHRILPDYLASLSRRKEGEVAEQSAMAPEVDEWIHCFWEMASYGRIPSENRELEAVFHWRDTPDGRYHRLEGLDLDQATWKAQYHKGASLHLQIVQAAGGAQASAPDTKTSLQVAIRRFAQVGLRVLPGGFGPGQSEMSHPQLGRLVELTQLLHQSISSDGNADLNLPPAAFDFSHEAPDGFAVTAEAGYRIPSVLPFWIAGALPSYAYLYLYRSLWNAQVEALYRYQARLSPEQIVQEETNQQMLDVLVLLHLHLVLLLPLFAGKKLREGKGLVIKNLLPLLTPLAWNDDLQMVIQEQRERLRGLLQAQEWPALAEEDESPNKRPAILMAQAQASFACALFFDNKPFISKNTIELLEEAVLKPLENDHEATSRLWPSVFSILYGGKYMEILPTRPEGMNLLLGISKLMQCFWEESEKYYLDWDMSYRNSIKTWEESRIGGFAAPRPYLGYLQNRPAILDQVGKEAAKSISFMYYGGSTPRASSADISPAKRADVSSKLTSVVPPRMMESGLPTPTPQARLSLDEDWGRLPPPRIIAQLVRHESLMKIQRDTDGLGTPDQFLRFLQAVKDHEPPIDLSNRRRISAVAGNCAVELERRQEFDRVQEIYEAALAIAPFPGVHFQFSDFLMDRRELELAAKQIELGESLQPDHPRLPMLKAKLGALREFGDELPADRRDAFSAGSTAGRHSDRFLGLPGPDLQHIARLGVIMENHSQTAQHRVWNFWSETRAWWSELEKLPKDDTGNIRSTRKRRTTCLRGLADFMAGYEGVAQEELESHARTLYILLLKEYVDCMEQNDRGAVDHNLASISRKETPDLALFLWQRAYPVLGDNHAARIPLGSMFYSQNQSDLADLVLNGQELDWSDPRLKRGLANGEQRFRELSAQVPDANTLLRAIGQTMEQFNPERQSKTPLASASVEEGRGASSPPEGGSGSEGAKAEDSAPPEPSPSSEPPRTAKKDEAPGSSKPRRSQKKAKKPPDDEP